MGSSVRKFCGPWEVGIIGFFRGNISMTIQAYLGIRVKMLLVSLRMLRGRGARAVNVSGAW